ncbi:hypothetical protein RDI58_024592 [Solanum bulbocastanum]|uniref:Uncharacterized protein n=1 Tax=Solanum bulbocastanum TaxID=147425 RepID=A0AAN8T1K4_SOLBU
MLFFGRWRYYGDICETHA